MSEILNGPKILPEYNNEVKNAVVFLHGMVQTEMIL